MKEKDFITSIKRAKLGVFHSRDAARLMEKSRKYAQVYLNRLEKRETIKRITKSKYCLAGTLPEVAASNLSFPSYVSFLSGLAYHKLTTQIPSVIHVVTNKSMKSVDYGGLRIKFVKTSPERIFGYQKHGHENGYAFVGEKEKILVDAAYLPRYCPLTEAKNAMESGVDAKKLSDYAKRMNSTVTIKRIGYLMQTTGLDASPLKKLINRSFDPLNPLLPGKGEKNREWKLVINEALE